MLFGGIIFRVASVRGPTFSKLYSSIVRNTVPGEVRPGESTCFLYLRRWFVSCVPGLSGGWGSLTMRGRENQPQVRGSDPEVWPEPAPQKSHLDGNQQGPEPAVPSALGTPKLRLRRIELCCWPPLSRNPNSGRPPPPDFSAPPWRAHSRERPPEVNRLDITTDGAANRGHQELFFRSPLDDPVRSRREREREREHLAPATTSAGRRELPGPRSSDPSHRVYVVTHS